MQLKVGDVIETDTEVRLWRIVAIHYNGCLLVVPVGQSCGHTAFCWPHDVLRKVEDDETNVR